MPRAQNNSESSAEENKLDSNLSEGLEENQGLEGGEEASSSNADDSNEAEDKHQSLLDVVKNAVEEPDEEGEPDPKDGKPEKPDDKNGDDQSKKDGKSKGDASSASGEGKKEEDEDAGFTEEELAKEKPSTQKRIRNILGKLEEAHSQVEQYKPHAERYAQIDGFMSQNGITPDEAAEAFTIMAMVKHDPAKALERMRQHVQTIASYVGEGELPADLQRKVEDGVLDEESAKEVAKARAVAQHEQQRRTQVETRSQQQQQQAALTQKQTRIAQAIDGWQADIVKSDPHYQQKHELVKGQLAALVGKLGQPENEQEAIQYAKIAYGMVNKSFQGFQPAPAASADQRPAPKQAKRPMPSRATSGPSPQRNPESILDVVKATVGK